MGDYILTFIPENSTTPPSIKIFVWIPDPANPGNTTTPPRYIPKGPIPLQLTSEWTGTAHPPSLSFNPLTQELLMVADDLGSLTQGPYSQFIRIGPYFQLLNFDSLQARGRMAGNCSVIQLKDYAVIQTSDTVDELWYLQTGSKDWGATSMQYTAASGNQAACSSLIYPTYNFPMWNWVYFLNRRAYSGELPFLDCLQTPYVVDTIKGINRLWDRFKISMPPLPGNSSVDVLGSKPGSVITQNLLNKTTKEYRLYMFFASSGKDKPIFYGWIPLRPDGSVDSYNQTISLRDFQTIPGTETKSTAKFQILWSKNAVCCFWQKDRLAALAAKINENGSVGPTWTDFCSSEQIPVLPFGGEATGTSSTFIPPTWVSVPEDYRAL